jgi:hypothetical protein
VVSVYITPTQTEVTVHGIGHGGAIYPKVIVPRGARALVPIGGVPDRRAYYIHPNGEYETVKLTVEFDELPEYPEE